MPIIINYLLSVSLLPIININTTMREYSVISAKDNVTNYDNVNFVSIKKIPNLYHKGTVLCVRKKSSLHPTWFYDLFKLETYIKFGLNMEYNIYLVDFASEMGNIEFLNLWKDKNLNLTYSSKSIDFAAAKNNIDVLNWWLNSGKELKYSNLAIEWAKRLGNIDTINWLEKNLIKNETLPDINIYDFDDDDYNLQIDEVSQPIDDGLNIPQSDDKSDLQQIDDKSNLQQSNDKSNLQQSDDLDSKQNDDKSDLQQSDDKSNLQQNDDKFDLQQSNDLNSKQNDDKSDLQQSDDKSNLQPISTEFNVDKNYTDHESNSNSLDLETESSLQTISVEPNLQLISPDQNLDKNIVEPNIQDNVDTNIQTNDVESIKVDTNLQTNDVDFESDLINNADIESGSNLQQNSTKFNLENNSVESNLCTISVESNLRTINMKTNSQLNIDESNFRELIQFDNTANKNCTTDGESITVMDYTENKLIDINYTPKIINKIDENKIDENKYMKDLDEIFRNTEIVEGFRQSNENKTDDISILMSLIFVFLIISFIIKSIV